MVLKINTGMTTADLGWILGTLTDEHRSDHLPTSLSTVFIVDRQWLFKVSGSSRSFPTLPVIFWTGNAKNSTLAVSVPETRELLHLHPLTIVSWSHASHSLVSLDIYDFCVCESQSHLTINRQQTTTGQETHVKDSNPTIQSNFMCTCSYAT